MHIPDGFLDARLWGPLDVLSGTFVAIGLRRVSATLEDKAVPLMGVLSAFIFAAQMINIPIAAGTSAHLLGGTLAGSLLGPWAGLTVMSVVLMVQCLLFQDGGLAALGANIFNMGIVGALGGALLYRLGRRTFAGRRPIFWSGFWAAWLMTTISAASCAAQLCASRVIPWPLGMSVIAGTHVLLGLFEGIVTGTVLEALSKTRPDLLEMGLRKV